MALNDYIINYSSTEDASIAGAFSKPAFVIPERSTDMTNTSLTLLGKYSLTSGEELQTDLVRLLENHARDTAPVNPTFGQLWFDTTVKLLKVYTPVPTGARWIAVGSNTTEGSSLPVASFSNLGAVKLSDPFKISEEGVLTLPDIVHINLDTVAKTNAQYIFNSDVTVSGALASYHPENYIVDDPQLEEFFKRTFITKGYADRIYAKANTSDPDAGYLPPASKNTVGGIIVGTPFTLSENGMISLDNLYYNVATATKPNEYNVNANLLTSRPAYSLDGNNFIGADATKPAAEYACYFTTKGYIDTYFIRKGDMSVIYDLPPANNVTLGGIMAKPPFIADAQGNLALLNVTYDSTAPAYTFNADIIAKKISTTEKATFNEAAEFKKPAYSFDNDNFISKDPAKTPADYSNFFVTKHYADSRYFLDPNAGTSNVGVRPTVATATQIGGVIPGKPFTVSSTGALTIPNMEYLPGAATAPSNDTVPGGSNTPTIEFKSKVKSSGILFSNVDDNGIFSDPSLPDEVYDPCFTTKKFNDDHYLASGDLFVTGTISKSPYVIEYAPGFSQSEFDGKDNALVNKKYVDSQTQTTSIGPTSPSVFPENSIITTKNGVLSSISGFAFDPDSGEIKSNKASLVSTATNDEDSALNVYNDQPSAEAGSSISLSASEPIPPIIPGQTPTAKPAISANIKLGTLKLGGWNGTKTVTGAKIESNSTETWTPTANGTNLVLKVTKKGTNTPVPAMTINDDRSIQIYQGFIETVNNTTNAEWTVDFTTGTIQVLTTSNNTTITMPTVAEFTGRSITMVIKYTGTHTITWAGGAISWPDNNTAPITTSATGATDVFMFFGDGTKIFGSVAGQSYVQ